MTRPPAAARRLLLWTLLGGTAAALAATALASCGSAARHDLTVTGYSPTAGDADDSVIEVHFDRPVVDDAAVGGAVDTAAVVIEPAVTWHGHWQDRQTLVIEPLEPLRASTRYHVRLAGDLHARSGGFGFDFVHRPLELDGVLGVDPRAIDPSGDLAVTFNQAVSAAAAAERCTLRHGDDDAVALAARDPGATDTTVVLRPARDLARDVDYLLACDGLTGAAGDAPIAATARLALHVRPPLRVTSFGPTGWDVAADEVSITVELSAPVTLDAIRAAVTASPAIPGIGAGSLDASGTRYQVVADLDTETDFTLQVAADLVDVHGECLGDAASFSFRTGDAKPRISMERGLFALEASAAGYPVWTRNVPQYDLTCAQIPRAKLVQTLTTQMNYDPWGGYDSDDDVDWDALGARKVDAKVSVADAKNKWHLDNLDLGARCGGKAGTRGVFLADVGSAAIADDPDRPWWSPRTNRVLVNVTDLGVLLEAGPASGLAWVTSLATGEPVAGARVIVYNPQGKQVWVDLTDKDGLVKLPGSAKLLAQASVDDSEPMEEAGDDWEDWDSYRSQRLIAVVEKGDDLAVVDGNWANGIQTWNFGVPEERAGGVTRIRGFIQSDRGLYRPGETVHFKGIAREIAAGRAPRVPSRQPVTVDVADSRGATVMSTQLPLSKFGGFAFDLDVGAEAPLGDWFVTAKIEGQVFRERFSVEEFRPASFEVKLEGGDKNPRLGERMDLTVDARYLFGAPVAAADVQWNVSRRDHWLRFPGYDDYTFADNGDRWWWWGDDRDSYGEFVSDGTGTTDDRGRLGFTVRDPDPSLTGPHDYVVSATVTDPADQAISTSRVVTAHQTDVYLGLHTQEYVQAVGMPFAVNVVAMTPAGARTAAKAHLSFIRKVRDCSWDQNGARSYWSCQSHDEIALERDVAIPATGQATERIYPKAPGDYVVRVETTDGRGNPVVTSSMLWVIGKGEAFWSGDESARMTLVASKAKYQPGDTARLVAQASLHRPTALITIERDGILSAEVRHLDSAAEGVELTIKDSWAPVVYARVALVSGRHGDGDRNRPQLKMGVVELKVESEHKRLDVQVVLDQAEVRPGAPVSGHVVVTSAGKPVRAELSLSVADEGVLQLIAYKTPDPMKTFYAAWGLGVDAGTNWNRLARLADPEAGDPDAGGDWASSSGPKVRSKFVSSAYWAPSLVTDAEGVAPFAFTAPDNLTAFRVMAVGADAGDRFGAGDTRLTVNKKLMATPVLPRFLGADDTLSVGVLIHNRTGKAGTAKVTAKADGVTLFDDVEEVAVAQDGQARVRFAAKASRNAAAQLTLAVTMNGEHDALTVTLPIRRPRVIDTTTVARGKIDGDGKDVTVTLPIAAATLRRESEVVVSVDRTGLGDLEPSLRYLVEYPYGCLEQTMSRFIPLAKAKDLSRSLGFTSLAGTKMDAFIAAGVAKVQRHQQGDGHFSLWPQSQTYPHLTAYALWGLTEARKAGIEVRDDTFASGLPALASWLARPDTIAPGNEGAAAAMAAYVLALHGQADAGALARLHEARAGLPRWGQAFLLRALVAAKASATLIDDVKTDLLKAIVVDGEVARVEENDHAGGYGHEYYMSSDTRATAMVLDALVETAPTDPMIGKLVAGLDTLRKADGAWGNTQENLWSLVALADYARLTAPGKATVAISAGGKPLSKKVLSGADVHVVKQALDALAGDTLTIHGDPGVRYAVRLVQARTDDGQAASQGFTLTREYLDAKGRAVTQVAAGDLVTVRLTMKLDAPRRWVALVDPMPAGFEAVNPALATSQPGAGMTTSSGGDRWWNPPTWDQTEVRDDRVQWFADYVAAGTHVMTYKARATIDGAFAVPPAHVEAMYEPDVMGRTASTTLVVK
ncbi:MAG: hypothetical protein H6708_23625 [Kofleriaceae bacterium]|nr:hypothetical protein [Myxococcales bacterium]MCB9563401.1 hypothetical protein [Kofleriaceae bacterium]